MKLKVVGILISFHPYNLHKISLPVKTDGLYAKPLDVKRYAFGPQKGCSPSLCKFIIKPIFLSLNFFIKLNLFINSSLGLCDAITSSVIKLEFNPIIALLFSMLFK